MAGEWGMSIESLGQYLGAIEDPRCSGKVEHRLLDILVIAVSAVIACAESWDDIALYGRSKLLWLRTFLDLPNGIPSHDTFRRVFMLIDPNAFEAGFTAWVGSLVDRFEREVVAIDGKTVAEHRHGKVRRSVRDVWQVREGGGRDDEHPEPHDPPHTGGGGVHGLRKLGEHAQHCRPRGALALLDRDRLAEPADRSRPPSLQTDLARNGKHTAGDDGRDIVSDRRRRGRQFVPQPPHSRCNAVGHLRSLFDARQIVDWRADRQFKGFALDMSESHVHLAAMRPPRLPPPCTRYEPSKRSGAISASAALARSC